MALNCSHPLILHPLTPSATLTPVCTPLIHIGYLTVEGNGYKTKLGTFGWSRSGGNGDFSSARGVGYNVQEAVLLTLRKGMTVGEWFNLASKGLIAIPIACGECEGVRDASFGASELCWGTSTPIHLPEC